MLGQRILPALDGPARVALLGTSHALARLVLQHAPGTKRLTHRGPAGWPPVLAHLLGTAWQPLADLELHVASCGTLVPPPPAGISRLVSHLRLEGCKVDALDAWQLHNASLWPHLQHLAVQYCRLAKPATAAMAQLQPIPGLQSLTWEDGLPQHGYGDPPTALLLALAANATRLHLHLGYGWDAVPVQAMQCLQRLTHVHVHPGRDQDVLLALLQHPTLEHVTLGDLGSVWPRTPTLDLPQQPCRWRTLTCKHGAAGVGIAALGRLPLHNLEQLSIPQGLYMGGGGDDSAQQAYARGVELLQQLHAGGRLRLHPGGTDSQLKAWGVPQGRGMFCLYGTSSHLAPVLHLVAEAGRGIHAVWLGYDPPPQEAPAPLVQHARSALDTVAFGLTTCQWVDDAWCAGLLRAAPDCVRRVNVRVQSDPSVERLRSCVQGLAHHVRRPLTLTLIEHATITHELEAELREAAERAAVGQLGQGLTLEVRRLQG